MEEDGGDKKDKEKDNGLEFVSIFEIALLL